MNTKIFCDIADLETIKKFNKKKIVKGFTTNPSLMRKAGAKDYKSYSKEILKICKDKYTISRLLAELEFAIPNDGPAVRGPHNKGFGEQL